MTPINKHTEKTTYKDEEVEVVGEVYPDPIKFPVPSDIEMFTKVSLVNRGVTIKKIYFPEQMIENGDLKKVVTTIKDNLEKYLA